MSRCIRHLRYFCHDVIKNCDECKYDGIWSIGLPKKEYSDIEQRLEEAEAEIKRIVKGMKCKCHEDPVELYKNVQNQVEELQAEIATIRIVAQKLIEEDSMMSGERSTKRISALISDLGQSLSSDAGRAYLEELARLREIRDAAKELKDSYGKDATTKMNAWHNFVEVLGEV